MSRYTVGRLVRGAALWLLCSLAAGPHVLAAGGSGTTSSANREHTLKAGFLVNFSQFTTWPKSAFDSSQSPFVIGIVGPDPFGPLLDAVTADVRVGGRPIVVRRLQTGDEIRGCHLLFVGEMQARELKRMVDLAGTAPVLTVSDEADFLGAGGIVRLRIENNRVRFDVNAAAARRAGLTFSSEMLQFAKVVTP